MDKIASTIVLTLAVLAAIYYRKFYSNDEELRKHLDHTLKSLLKVWLLMNEQCSIHDGDGVADTCLKL